MSIYGNKFLFILTISLLSATGWISCEGQPELLDEETYGNILIELTIVNQMDEVHMGDRSREEFIDEIYQKYDVSSEIFRMSHEHYQRDVEQQMKRVEELGKRLRSERETIQQAEKEFRQKQDQDSTAAVDSLRDININL